jgi:hypothetical protein
MKALAEREKVAAGRMRVVGKWACFEKTDSKIESFG